MSLITVQNLKFKYPQQKHYCVDNVTFVIEKGSYTAFVGLNGSGKSTLTKLICGLETPEEGTIQIKENNRIGIVFQSPKNQIISSIVSRDTSFGPQNLGLNKSEVELRTIECLNITDMLDRASDSTSALSLGQMQKVALSGVIALHPEILILDEAISMLDPESKKEVLEFVKYYHKCGNTIIQITHDNDVVDYADNVICMENGKISFYGTKNAFLNDTNKVKIIKGNVISPKSLEERKQKFQNMDFNTDCTLNFENVCFEYGQNQKNGVKNVDFKLYKGTLTALTGPSGAGKSTILELCTGLLKLNSGKIYAKSKPTLAQQNASAALFENFVVDDVAFGPKNNGKTNSELKEIVKSSMNKAAIPYDDFFERRTFELSGGEQRRLSIAGILALDSEIILFDEPTAGLDCKTRFEVMQMLRDLANEGKTVLFSTHRYDEADFSDREIHIQNGKIVSDTFINTFENIIRKNNESSEKLESNQSSILSESMPYQTVDLLENLRKVSLSLSTSGKKKLPLIGKIHPALRILLYLTLFSLSLCFSKSYFCISMLLVTMIYSKICGFSLKRYLSTCIKIIPFLLIFAVFQLIFHPALDGEQMFISWKWLTITPSKLLFCQITVLRTFCALGVICSFFVSTPEYDLIDGLQLLLKPLSLIKIPVRYSILVIEIIFRFIPLLVEEASAIIKTQTIRGGMGKVNGKMAKIRVMIPLIVPLIVQTIKRSSSLGVAITMRGFM